MHKNCVAEFLRISEFYEKIEGHKPELIIVTPFIGDRAREFAKSRGDKVYSIKDLSRYFRFCFSYIFEFFHISVSTLDFLVSYVFKWLLLKFDVYYLAKIFPNKC